MDSLMLSPKTMSIMEDNILISSTNSNIQNLILISGAQLCLSVYLFFKFIFGCIGSSLLCAGFL